LTTKLFFAAAAVAVIAVLSFVLLNSGPAASRSAVTLPSNSTNVNSSKVLFSSTNFAPYSYLIYPGVPSSQARAALSGFNMNSTLLQNGTTKVSVSLSGTNQQQSIYMKPGYKLYIIETNFGDDGFNREASLGDDGFVVVDPNGHVM
jgi:hypothetical protein